MTRLIRSRYGTNRGVEPDLRAAAALLCALGLAAEALAAATGMVYVQSKPRGATVVIDGRERGKTPVLVRGIASGEVEVVLALPGAKPVVRRVTVRAGKLAMVKVEIEIEVEVPAAARAEAAATGMIYVKSKPRGATVLVAGRERGKTPVLVKGLAPGQVEVELRLSGAKPVVRRVTVRAKKSVTINVKIDLPAATLTIVSDPLEATIFLDRRERGTTPLTLEGVKPGRHELILYKNGYRRLVKKLDLKPGKDLVLELRLEEGSELATGDSMPGAETGSSVPAEEAGATPAALQMIFADFEELVREGDIDGARRYVERELLDPRMAYFRDGLRAAVRVADALRRRREAIREGAKALVGGKARLKTKRGYRRGRIEAVSDDGIAGVSEIIINGQSAGETRFTIPWSSLAPAEERRLARSWKAQGPDAQVAVALLALGRRDKTAARRALEAAGDHPVARYLREKDAALAHEAAQDSAHAAWQEIERRAGASRMSYKQARELLKKIASFRKLHGESRFAASLGDRVAEARSDAWVALVRAAGVPFDAVEFRGHSYKIYGQQISWKGANVFCRRKKGHLVTITSRAENSFVSRMLGRYTPQIWIGLTDERRRNVWEWVTGERVTFTSWSSSRYRGRQMGGEHYGRMSWGTWVATEGQEKLHFICEWDVAATEVR